MEIEIRGQELFNSVRDLQRILAATDREAVTIEAYGETPDAATATIRAGGGDNMAELKIAARVLKPGKATVPFRELAQACAPYHRKQLTVSADELHLRVAYYPESVALTTIAVDLQPFPGPAVDAPRTVFDTMDVLDVMSDVVHAMSSEPQIRPALCGVKFELGADMKLRAIATDGKRLAVSARQIRRAEMKTPEFDVFLPRPATEFLARALHGETISFCKFGRSVAIETDGSYGAFWEDVRFPLWNKCVPEDPSYRATFNGGELADALNHAIEALEIRDEVDEFGERMETSFQAHIYAFRNGRAEITVSRCVDDDGGAKFFSAVSCALPDGEEFKADINARYLLDAVRGHEGAVEVYANPISKRCKELGPFVFHYPDAPDAFEVVMPIRMS